MRSFRRIALLALLLTIFAASPALAAAGDADIANPNDLLNEYGDSLTGACAMDGALYLCGTNHIFTYRPGDAELSAAEFALELDEDESGYPVGIASDGETLYLLVPVAYVGEGEYEMDRLDLVPAEIDGGEVILGDPYEIDVDDLLVDTGVISYLPDIPACCWVGGRLILCADDSGQRSVYVIEPEDEYGWFVEDLDMPVRCIASYGEDQLLIACCDAGESTLYLYDPEEEELEEAASAQMDSGAENLFAGLAYSAEDDRLFYLDGGSVMAADGLDLSSAQRAASVSMNAYVQSAGMALPGGLYAYYGGYTESVAVRATRDRAQITARLVVKGTELFDGSSQVASRFSAAHDDVELVMNDGAPEFDKLIEAMMNQDDSVDVYLLPVDSEAYDALYNRGFMVPITDPALIESAAQMYPAIRDAVTKDGELVALPVHVSGEIVGLDYEGFAQIGIDREDVPQSWPELLDFLPEACAQIPEDRNILAFDLGYTQDEIRQKLLNEILRSWNGYLTASGQEMHYDDPALSNALEKLMALDLDALGVARDEQEADDTFRDYEGGDERPYRLLQFETGCTFGSFYSLAEPAPLAIAPGEVGQMPVKVTAAIINPYSKRVDLAQEFISALSGCVSRTTSYCLSDALNDPVILPRTKKMMDDTQAEIDRLKAQLETADAVDAPAIEASIAEQERQLEGLDQFGWEIAQKDIDWYRAHAGNLTVERYNYLSAGDDEGELADLVRQLFSGRLDPGSFLKKIDEKVRMRQAEGY